MKFEDILFLIQEQLDTPDTENSNKKKLSEIEKVKLKWKEEHPGLVDADINDTINFFNRKKNGLRPYKDPNTPNYVNLPEIVALKTRFPEMNDILRDISKIRDIQNYTWDQMEYYMDRVNETDVAREMDFTIDGDTIETRKASALKKWENPRNKIIDENNIIVYRIEGKDESIALGRLQNILVSQYGGNNWCITNLPGGATNLYDSYRNNHGRSFYFVLNKNREENDPYYLSTIEPVNKSSYNYNTNGSFCITPRQNGTQCGKTWEDIVEIHPQLSDKERYFQYFDKTAKEKSDIAIGKITFNSGDENDFAVQRKEIQKKYIESGRLINDIRSFSVLPVELRKDYIARTTLEDYKHRFKSNHNEHPFALLNLIETENPGLFKFLDNVVLKTQLGLKRGVRGIKESILGLNFRRGFSDIEKPYTLFMERNGNKCGVINVSTIEWIKPMEYIKTTSTPLVKKITDDNNDVKIVKYIMNRYSVKDDYFYFFINVEDITNKTSPNYMKGIYLDKEEGNNLLNSDEYRILK